MTKEAQRAELHKTIWRIANDLRGSVDGWDFKQYVLGMLFYRFISENLAAYLNVHEHKAGTPSSTTPLCPTRPPSSAGPTRSARRASTSSRASCS
jgi:type I restriction-modification system DNA methylase subunit